MPCLGFEDWLNRDPFQENSHVVTLEKPVTLDLMLRLPTLWPSQTHGRFLNPGAVSGPGAEVLGGKVVSEPVEGFVCAPVLPRQCGVLLCGCQEHRAEAKG